MRSNRLGNDAGAAGDDARSCRADPGGRRSVHLDRSITPCSSERFAMTASGIVDRGAVSPKSRGDPRSAPPSSRGVDDGAVRRVGRETTVAEDMHGAVILAAVACSAPSSGRCRYRCRPDAPWPPSRDAPRQRLGVPPLRDDRTFDAVTLQKRGSSRPGEPVAAAPFGFG